ncbi:hypothetical protein [Clostridium sp.]|uniref:hypothetical protein n=1 Tax=Clostridium sp. TaxID=1506 RepID=UPI0032173397
MKKILIGLIVSSVLSTANANANKQGAEHLLNSYAKEKGEAKVKLLKSLQDGHDTEILSLAYYCNMVSSNIVIKMLADLHPELTLTHGKLIESAYNDEIERKRILNKYSIEYDENGCGENIPIKLNTI